MDASLRAFDEPLQIWGKFEVRHFRISEPDGVSVADWVLEVPFGFLGDRHWSTSHRAWFFHLGRSRAVVVVHVDKSRFAGPSKKIKVRLKYLSPTCDITLAHLLLYDHIEWYHYKNIKYHCYTEDFNKYIPVAPRMTNTFLSSTGMMLNIFSHLFFAWIGREIGEASCTCCWT